MAEKKLNHLSRKQLIGRIEELESQIAESENAKERPPDSDSADLQQECDNEAEEQQADAPPPDRFARSRARLRIIRKVCASLTVAAAAVVLIVYFVFPVMQVYGSSMSSTLVDGDVVIARRTAQLDRGVVCAFYYGNRILCKRVIGLAGDVIEMDDSGVVIVNGEEIDEPYLKGRSLGDCDIEFPYTVPAGTYFVLGDNRRSSIDSRNSEIGCISEDQVVGWLMFRILPLPSFGEIE